MRAVLRYVFRWIIVLGLFCFPSGLIMAGLGWHEASRIADVLARGAAAEARIEGAVRTTSGRRRRTSYSLNLAWRRDDQVMRAERVAISARLAGEIIVDEIVTRASVAIRYLPDDPAHPIVVEDADEQRRSNEEMVGSGTILAIIGAIISAFWLWRIRRSRSLAVAPAR